MRRAISWLMSRTIEAWDDWRDPDWNPVFDPYEGLINNPTPRQVEKMFPKEKCHEARNRSDRRLAVDPELGARR